MAHQNAEPCPAITLEQLLYGYSSRAARSTRTHKIGGVVLLRKGEMSSQSQIARRAIFRTRLKYLRTHGQLGIILASSLDLENAPPPIIQGAVPCTMGIVYNTYQVRDRI